MLRRSFPAACRRLPVAGLAFSLCLWHPAGAQERLPSHAQSCMAWGSAVSSVIWQANYCTRSEDCVAEPYGCPFGCEGLVNRAEVPRLAEQVRQYHEKCDMCTYRCQAIPPGSVVVCEQSRCVRNHPGKEAAGSNGVKGVK